MRLIGGVIFVLAATFGAYGQKAELTSNGFDAANRPVISVYPNPATDFISVKSDVADLRSARFVLYTIIGNEVAVEPEIADESEVRIRVKDLPSGYYLLAIRNEQSGFRTTRKFLKK